jgi:hypothetical protein
MPDHDDQPITTSSPKSTPAKPAPRAGGRDVDAETEARAATANAGGARTTAGNADDDDPPMTAERDVSRGRGTAVTRGGVTTTGEEASGDPETPRVVNVEDADETTCPGCGAVWPTVNMAAGEVIVCTCGRELQIAE